MRTILKKKKWKQEENGERREKGEEGKKWGSTKKKDSREERRSFLLPGNPRYGSECGLQTCGTMLRMAAVESLPSGASPPGACLLPLRLAT